MPEGDTIHRIAGVLRRAILGEAIVEARASGRADAVLARGAAHLAGRSIAAVEAQGKHLLIVCRKGGAAGEAPLDAPALPSLTLVRSDIVVHSHLGLDGSWHLYRPDQEWQRPERYAALVLRTPPFVAACFDPQILEILPARHAAHHRSLEALGPDLLADDFDAAAARARLRARRDVEIGDALLDQHLLAGIGNVYKSEVLFVTRVSPFAPVRDLSDETLDALIAESRRLLRLNLKPGARRTRSSLASGRSLWVYGRAGRGCSVCGDGIRVRAQGPNARLTFYCARCQATAGRSSAAASSGSAR